MPVSIEQLIEAVEQDIRALRERIYRLEMSAARFNDMFERMFNEELDRRLGRGSNLQTYGGAAVEMPALEHLRYQVEKMKGEPNAKTKK
jgi:hypothetical protein